MTMPTTLPRRTRGGDLLATLLLVAAPVVALVAASIWRDRVPTDVPRHWNIAGEVDGTTEFVTFTVLTVGAAGLLALLGLVLVWAVRNRDVVGFSAPLTAALVWFLSGLYAGTLHASLDVANPEDVALPWPAMIVSGVLAAVVAFVVSRAVPAVREVSDSAVSRTSSMSFADGEKVVWVSGARGLVMAWIGAALALVGAVTWVLSGPAGAVLVAVGLLMAFLHSITVRIDDAGVRVSWGPLGWPYEQVALGDVEDVVVTVARPGEWGGWGWRRSLKGSAHLARAGEAIVLKRRGRPDLLITVDGAEQATDVLTALLERAAR